MANGYHDGAAADLYDILGDRGTVYVDIIKYNDMSRNVRVYAVDNGEIVNVTHLYASLTRATVRRCRAQRGGYIVVNGMGFSVAHHIGAHIQHALAVFAGNPELTVTGRAM